MDLEAKHNFFNDTENQAGLYYIYRSHKLFNYNEPQREGSIRGEPIGASRKKYLAMLLTLSQLNQKEIAFEVGVTHDLSRKWPHQPDFKAKVDEFEREFVKIACNHTLAVFANLRNNEPESRAKILRDLKIQADWKSAVSDLNFLSYSMQIKILERAKSICENKANRFDGILENKADLKGSKIHRLLFMGLILRAHGLNFYRTQPQARKILNETLSEYIEELKHEKPKKNNDVVVEMLDTINELKLQDF